MSESLAPDFLSMLVCPVTHSPLIQAGDWLYSTDSADRRKYPIRDGIPVMLVDESQQVSEEEFKDATTRS